MHLLTDTENSPQYTAEWGWKKVVQSFLSLSRNTACHLVSQLHSCALQGILNRAARRILLKMYIRPLDYFAYKNPPTSPTHWEKQLKSWQGSLRPCNLPSRSPLSLSSPPHSLPYFVLAPRLLLFLKHARHLDMSYLLVSLPKTLFLHLCVWLYHNTPSVFIQIFAQVPFSQWGLTSPPYSKVLPLPCLIFFITLTTFNHTNLFYCMYLPLWMWTPAGQESLIFLFLIVCVMPCIIGSQ